MTRTATRKLSTKLLKSTGTTASKPTRGRPPGSKDRAVAEPARTTRAAARTATSRKASPAAPKLNKAELEAQLVKLERTVTRLREQNKELKRLLREGAEAEPAAAPTPTRRSIKVTAVAKRRRPKLPKPAPHDVPADGAEADVEDHEAAA